VGRTDARLDGLLPSQLMSRNDSLASLFGLSGQVAVVIGGGGHLCSAMARGLAQAGASVAVLDVRLEKAERVAAEIQAETSVSTLALCVNVISKGSLEDALESILKSYGRVDILVNGAGINAPTPFLEIKLDDWYSVMDSQITGTMLACQVFGSQMLRQVSGSIINISSASAGPPLSKAFAYSVAKAGILNLTMNLAREWATQGVRVNAIRPGFFPTEWNRINFITPEREQSILKHTPMARYGQPSELIGATIWLASSSSSFVTGSEIAIDGGFSCMSI